MQAKAHVCTVITTKESMLLEYSKLRKGLEGSWLCEYTESFSCKELKVLHGGLIITDQLGSFPPNLYTGYAQMCLVLMEVWVMLRWKKNWPHYIDFFPADSSAFNMLMHTGNLHGRQFCYSFFKPFFFSWGRTYYSFLGLMFQGG